MNASKLHWLARMGYGARGIVYVAIGLLAVMAALGAGGETTNSKGVVMNILGLPFGYFLVVLLIVGLMGYVLWRVVQGIADTDDHGHSFKGIMVRGGLLVSAITHFLLAIWAANILVGFSDSSSGGSGSSGILNGIVSHQVGLMIFTAVGVAIIVVGILLIYKGASAGFEKYMNLPRDKASWLKPMCQFGLVARGLVWCVLGWMIVRSAFFFGDKEKKTTDDALNVIASLDHGSWILAIVASGLFAFGAYSMLEAMYRRINMPA